MKTPEGLCTACGTDYCADHRPASQPTSAERPRQVASLPNENTASVECESVRPAKVWGEGGAPDYDRLKQQAVNISTHITTILTSEQLAELNIGAGTDLDMAVFRIVSELSDRMEAPSSPPEGLTTLVAKWRQKATEVSSFHATMATGWGACADELDAVLRTADPPAAPARVEWSDEQIESALYDVFMQADQCGICGCLDDDEHAQKPHGFESIDKVAAFRAALRSAQAGDETGTRT